MREEDGSPGHAPSPRGPVMTQQSDRMPSTAAPLKNICCVGDDDQSIYGWRGAEVDNILRFEHDFPGAKVIRLERNYRSTAHILAAASHLIAHNEGRLGKTLRTEDEPGEKVQVTSCWDSEEEARAIGEEIEQLQRDDGSGQPHPLDEIAILVRASFQMREFEDRFVTLGLPYRVIGGPRFYERQEIRDALAYLRVIHSPADDLAFERIVNVPKRGLGDATVQLLHDHARKQRIPLTEAARAVIETDELKPKPRGALRDADGRFDRWRVQKDALPHTELAEIVLDESGYTEMWQKDRSRRRRRPARKPEGADPLHGGVREPRRLSRAHLAGDGHRQERGRRGLDHDLAFRQGARIRHRVPARLGGRPVPATSARSTTRAAPGSRRSAALRMSGSRARAAAPRSISPPTAACTGCGRRTSPRASSTSCRRRDVEVTESKGGFGGLRQRRRLALRRDDPVRLELRHAGLAARAARKAARAAAASATTASTTMRRVLSGR